MNVIGAAGVSDYDISLSNNATFDHLEDGQLTVYFNAAGCFGTAGTFGSATGCFGTASTAGSFGCGGGDGCGGNCCTVE